MKKFYVCLASLFALLSFQASAIETNFKGKTYCFKDSVAKTDFDKYTEEINKIDQCIKILDYDVKSNLSSAMLNGQRQFYSHAYYNLVKGLVSAGDIYNLVDLQVAQEVAFKSHSRFRFAKRPFEYHSSNDMRLHEISQVGNLDLSRLKVCEALIESARQTLDAHKTFYVKEIQNILKNQKCIE